MKIKYLWIISVSLFIFLLVLNFSSWETKEIPVKKWKIRHNPTIQWQLPQNWKKPNKSELKKKLSELQFKVTQEEGTEYAFRNEYHNNKQEGIYVDIVSGEPLFSSLDKYDSGTGWPSFTKPLISDLIVLKKDNSFGANRTEVRSKIGDSHLGHVFQDGPQPTGLRYCMNSASLRFIPVKDLKKEGYESFEALFDKKSEP